MTEPLLTVEDLDVRYGSSRALFGVSLTVDPGTVLAVLGANGAGKSTLARAVSGLVPPTAGRVFFDGQEITGQPAHRIRKLGLTYIPEGRGIFPGSDRRRQPADGGRPRKAARARRRHRPGDRAFPGAGAAQDAAGGKPLGWRAADAGAGPRTGGLTEARHRGRDVVGSGADRDRVRLPGPRGSAPFGHHDRAHRAVRPPCPGHGGCLCRPHARAGRLVRSRLRRRGKRSSTAISAMPSRRPPPMWAAR